MRPHRADHGRGGWDLRHYVRARLHRRLFVAMSSAIFVSLLASILAALWWGQSRGEFDPRRVEHLVSSQFARVWHDETERSHLAEQAALTFGVALRLTDPSGRSLGEFGGRCTEPKHTVNVSRETGQELGQVGLCSSWAKQGFRAPWLIALFVFAFFLWISAGIVASRLGRPLGKLVQVTREIGSGKLSSRARLGRHEAGELGILAESINDMATRIEKQLDDQKELLAAVSHEMRTPLARLRVISELLEDQAAPNKLTSDMQREIVELDDLIDQLLANSRLEFHALRSTEHDASQLVLRCLARKGLPQELFVPSVGEERELRVLGDATLLGRALLNLFNNAELHGGGMSSVQIARRSQDAVELSVVDRGPGFSTGEERRVFEPFYRGQAAGKSAGTLGLGLSLVRRIAVAHGGDAEAVNLPEGGARVSFWVQGNF